MLYQVATDEYTDDEAQKCYNCNGKSIAETKCCQRKLCQFHLRMDLEDDILVECQFCTEIKSDDKTWSREQSLIYCREHMKDDMLKFCDHCKFHYCQKHFAENWDAPDSPTLCGHGWTIIHYPGIEP